jgi:hypothetical protein
MHVRSTNIRFFAIATYDVLFSRVVISMNLRGV